MKWYSVKKYIPAQDGIYFVRSKSDNYYIVYYDGVKWENLNDHCLPITDVTHFCVIDPIEIEND